MKDSGADFNIPSKTKRTLVSAINWGYNGAFKGCRIMALDALITHKVSAKLDFDDSGKET
jgi:hypothetical protein